MGFKKKRFQEKGFTLVEVLVAMATGAILFTAVIGVFLVQRKAYTVQEQTTEMVQTVRAAMDMICREARMAGYNPTGADFDGIPYHASELRILADFRGKKTSDSPDGDTNDPHEDITYRYNPKDLQIERNTGGGSQPFAENITDFRVVYLNRQGLATTTTKEIFQVKIVITARTGVPDLSCGVDKGFRSYTVTCLVTPVNLSVQKS